jgi:hypothetical protein
MRVNGVFKNCHRYKNPFSYVILFLDIGSQVWSILYSLLQCAKIFYCKSFPKNTLFHHLRVGAISHVTLKIERNF